MLKRILCALMAALLMLSCSGALADTPKTIEIVPYEEIPENRDGLYHYLLLCLDQWQGGLNDHTDGIVILTLDTRAHRIMLTSIIRDALIQRPDGKYGRINNVVLYFDPESLCKVISEHLGIKIEKYVMFDFQQVANIVDYMGGVEITVDASEASYLRRYPLDAHQTEPKMNRAGTYLFTGRAAVIYMRIRKAGGGGDFMRTQRVRTVLSTLADKCRTMTYEQARALVDSIASNTTSTNMSMEEMVMAMEQAYSLRSCVIEELRIPQDDAVHPLTHAGMATQEIDWVMSREDLNDFLECGWLIIDDEEYED